MISALAEFAEKFNACACGVCAVESKGQVCELKFHGFPRSKQIFNIDCIDEKGLAKFAGSKCDHIVVCWFNDFVYFIPVEFKTGEVDTEHVKKQLEAGVKFFRKHVRCEMACYPVLVSRRIPAGLRRKRVWFSNNRTERIRHVRCNDQLKWRDVMSEAS